MSYISQVKKLNCKERKHKGQKSFVKKMSDKRNGKGE